MLILPNTVLVSNLSVGRVSDAVSGRNPGLLICSCRFELEEGRRAAHRRVHHDATTGPNVASTTAGEQTSNADGNASNQPGFIKKSGLKFSEKNF